MADSRHLEK